MEAANIVLSPLLQVIFDRLASPALQKLSDIWGVKDNHDSLQRDLMRVQAILQDAGEKQLTNKSVRLWLSNLKNAASDAEDLLDSFITQETIKGYDAEDLLMYMQLCIPIIGIGGIGKTTLTQLAYNDERVVQHFDSRIWIFVSEDFNVKKIMQEAIERATEDECKLSKIELLQSLVSKLLQKKRYLIVLDDVWTEDQDDWNNLRPLCLPVLM
ncbi:hypothetical protein L3X38_043054 [Prunus dulcis]|uniref:NB-ARC domain-containing disease resistance protein n=1 Tax=Prunus dulcis TaxID=3755 RepID=A0AAD4UWD8_PRUDU|nr:hypothetical protein L3X38_043054 [Prunus dulcis]